MNNQMDLNEYFANLRKVYSSAAAIQADEAVIVARVPIGDFCAFFNVDMKNKKVELVYLSANDECQYPNVCMYYFKTINDASAKTRRIVNDVKKLYNIK